MGGGGAGDVGCICVWFSIVSVVMGIEYKQ